MTMTRICEVRNNQLVIPMPESYERRTVRVLIEDEVQEESYEDEMKRAMQDPRFLADMREVMEDFKYLDGQDIHE